MQRNTFSWLSLWGWRGPWTCCWGVAVSSSIPWSSNKSSRWRGTVRCGCRRLSSWKMTSAEKGAVSKRGDATNTTYLSSSKIIQQRRRCIEIVVLGTITKSGQCALHISFCFDLQKCRATFLVSAMWEVEREHSLLNVSKCWKRMTALSVLSQIMNTYNLQFRYASPSPTQPAPSPCTWHKICILPLHDDGRQLRPIAFPQHRITEIHIQRPWLPPQKRRQEVHLSVPDLVSQIHGKARQCYRQTSMPQWMRIQLQYLCQI